MKKSAQNNELIESYDWILKNVLSCKNGFHLQCCANMIALFDTMYADEELTDGLKIFHFEKYAEIYGILI